MCAAGHLGSWVPGGGGCIPCYAGTFKAATGDGPCYSCAAGQGSSAGATACVDCLADEYSANPGDPCSACDATTETTDSLTGQTGCGK